MTQRSRERISSPGPPRRPASQPTTPAPGMGSGRRFLGELLGTFLLVLCHAGAATAARLLLARAGMPKLPAEVLFLALADGLSLFVIILIVGRISGVLINPAVTLGLASARRFPWREVAPYIAAELIGAVLAAALILALYGHDATSVGRLGAVRPGEGIALWQAMLAEAAGAFVLVLAISATAEDPRAPSDWAGLTIGMALAAIVFFIEPVSGASVNPARAFGPDLLDALLGVRVDWGVYLLAYALAPVLGAVSAAHLYGVLAHQPAEKPSSSAPGV